MNDGILFQFFVLNINHTSMGLLSTPQLQNSKLHFPIYVINKDTQNC